MLCNKACGVNHVCAFLIYIYTVQIVTVHFRCSLSHCSRYRTTNVEHSLVVSPHVTVNSCWVNPMEIHHTNLTTNIPTNPSANPLHHPCIPRRHVGMAAITRVCYQMGVYYIQNF